MPTVIFTVTDSEDKIDLVARLLESNSVHYQKDDGEVTKKLSQKERLLKRYRERSHLRGMSQERQKLGKEFREDFQL